MFVWEKITRKLGLSSLHSMLESSCCEVSSGSKVFWNTVSGTSMFRTTLIQNTCYCQVKQISLCFAIIWLQLGYFETSPARSFFQLPPGTICQIGWPCHYGHALQTESEKQAAKMAWVYWLLDSLVWFSKACHSVSDGPIMLKRGIHTTNFDVLFDCLVEAINQLD